MASGIPKCVVPENKPDGVSDSADMERLCVFVPKKNNQKLLEAVKLLATKIEDMDQCQTPEPTNFSEVYSVIENILRLLGTEKPPSQSPLLDQLLNELQKLKSSTPSSPAATDQQLAGIERNLIHVMANVGYDILTAVQDVQNQITVLAEPHQSAELDGLRQAFTVDPKDSKQQSIIKYIHFLQQVPHCDGTSLESTNSKSPAAGCQYARYLDLPVHLASPAPLYNVCPIELIFNRFEYEKSTVVIINFAAAASYTNFVSSVFIPNPNGSVPVQIPWMSNMQNIHVLGKVVADIEFSKTTPVPIRFQMNVIDWTDHGNRVVILGRDFVDQHVQSVHHDSNTVILKDSREAEKTFEKRFVYLASVIRDIETKFCRYQLKKEVKGVGDVQAQIDRLQKVLVQHVPTSEQTPETQQEEPESAVNKEPADETDCKPLSEVQNLKIVASKSCGSAIITDDYQAKSQSTNMQPSQSSSSDDVVEESSVTSLQMKMVEKEDTYSTTSTVQPKEELKLSSQLKVSKKNDCAPLPTLQNAETKAVKVTAKLPNVDNFKDMKKDNLKTSSQSKEVKNELPATKVLSSVPEKPPSSTAEKPVSKTGDSAKSSMEEKFVKSSSQLKNTDIGSKPAVQVKENDLKKTKPISEPQIKMYYDQEKMHVEVESDQLEVQVLDTVKKCFQAGSLTTFHWTQSKKPSHQKGDKSEEKVKLPETKSAEKVSTDPLRTKPPTVKKEDSADLEKVKLLETKSAEKVSTDPIRTKPPTIKKKDSEDLEKVKLLETKSAEKVSTDPIRTKPPTIKKKDSADLMAVDSLPQSGKNEASSAKSTSLLSMENTETLSTESHSQFGDENQQKDQSTIRMKGKESSSEPKKTEK